jgi:hypothetical protein
MDLKSTFDWKPLPKLIDEERDRQRADKLARVTQEAEDYWNATAPYGGKRFTLADGIELLLYDLRRCQAAVAGIFEKEREQKALLDHKAATGQECEADRQRWFAYLDVAHIAREALSPAAPSEHSLESSS